MWGTQQLVNLQSLPLGVFCCRLRDCMAHSLTSSASSLADGDVITVLVVDLPRVFAHRMGASFAAVKHDGSVVTWGDAASGGNSDSVKDQLTGGVRHVFGNERAFAAVKEDGSVVTWDDADFGGNSDEVRDQLTGGVRHSRWKFGCLCRREGRRLCGHVGR